MLNKKTGRPTGTSSIAIAIRSQEMEIRDDDELKLKDESKFGEVEDVDRVERWIDVRKSRGIAEDASVRVVRAQALSDRHDAESAASTRLTEVLSGRDAAVVGSTCCSVVRRGSGEQQWHA